MMKQFLLWLWRECRSFMQQQPLVRGLVYLLLFFIGLLLFAASWLPVECGYCSLCNFLGVGTKEAAIRSLGIAVAGLLSMLALRAAHRRAEAVQKTALATEDKLVQEQFRDAIQRLDSKTESVRLGGAYALFRLALEKERLRRSIAEILCSHILVITGSKKYQEDFTGEPSMEIQALMQLLFEGTAAPEDRSKDDRAAFWKGLRADLSGGYFRGLKLANAQFRGADLGVAQFQDADLASTGFQGAFLACAEFQGAVLAGAGFQGAVLAGAGFQGATFVDVKFQGAFLFEAGFQGATFVDVKFQGVTSRTGFPPSFEQRIKAGVDRDADLSGTVFAGGLEQGQIDQWVDEMKKGGKRMEKRIEFFKQRVSVHVGGEVSHQLPAGAEGGRYGEAEARQWIEQYKKAMGTTKAANEED